MVNNCPLCSEIKDIKRKKNNPFFVTELKTGYLSLGHNQYYKGYCFFASKTHTTGLHKLGNESKKQFLFELSLVGEAIYAAFKPVKLNIELLGNSAPHLHWHIFPRYKKDILPKIPVWNNPNFLMYKTRPSKSELDQLRKRLLKELDKVLKR